MFCQLEKIELKIDTCPTKGCMYRGVGGICWYAKLSNETVVIKDIADARQEKQYKVAASAVMAKRAVVVGTILINYTNYIKDSFPERRNRPREEDQTVNNKDDKHVSRILSSIFGLTPDQQRHFWEPDRLTKWANRMNVLLTSQDIRAALLSATASNDTPKNVP